MNIDTIISEKHAFKHRGISIIELLVILGIIAILTALLIPALQFSREASRRIRCSGNLKELGLAALSFETDVGSFPPASTAKLVLLPRNGLIGINLFSPQCIMLNYLEKKDIFNMINFNLPIDINLIESRIGQWTVASQKITTYLCPSDPQVVGGTASPNSYRACRGVEPMFGKNNRSNQGIFYYANRGVHPSEITDGLSYTLLFSEKPIGSGTSGNYSPFRDWADVSQNLTGGQDWVAICSSIKNLTPKRLNAGATWVIGASAFSLFNTTYPPNNSIADCGAGVSRGLFSARSYHPGGVQGVMADGSVKFFTSSVGESVWRALGTRAGGEVDVDSF